MTPMDELVAREEIRQLMARYATAGDSGRLEEFSQVFAEGASLRAPGLDLKTRAGIVAGLFGRQGHAGAPVCRIYRHHLTTSKVDFATADTAHGRTYFMAVTDVGLDHTGVYTDEFRREATGWKIAHRQVRVDFIAPQSLIFPA